MARKYDVTRTFNIVKYKCCVVNDKKEFSYVTVSGEELLSDDKAIAYCRKLVAEDGFILVNIESIDTEVVCYGMTKEDFIKTATRLNPTTRKPIE